MLLITGSNGFLGSYLKENIEDHTVKTLSRSGNVDYAVDLADSIPNIKDPITLVIHCAGKAHSVPKNETESNEFYKVNVTGTANLLKGLENQNVKSFVFISSVSVYGLEKGENIDETYALNAKDPYGLSKIEAEKLVIDWGKTNNVKIVILRLPLLVGHNPPGNLGAMQSLIKKGFFPLFKKGSAKRSMLLISDLPPFLSVLFESEGTYNLTDGLHPSYLALSNKLKSKINSSAKLVIIPRLLSSFMSVIPMLKNKIDKLTNSLTFSDIKARKELNWNPNSVLKYYD